MSEHHKIVLTYEGDDVYKVTIECERARQTRGKAYAFSVLVVLHHEEYRLYIEPDTILCPYCGKKIKLHVTYDIDAEDE